MNSTKLANKVIRHKVTRAFFTAGNWSTDFAAAQIFTDIVAVFRTRDQYQIAEAEVVLLMNEYPSAADVTMDLAVAK
jgi:hypothetical protein